jgi:hypothetical protein
MEDGEMEKLTTARSSGKIIVTGVKKAVTDARTRLLMLSNPKTRQMTMSQFSYGIQALNTIFSKPEDIRRLDFALAVASDDLPPHIPNTPLESIPEVEHTYTTELCKDLILWAWTRRPEHIVFDDLATAKILEYAQLMGDKYVGDVMLVISADQRHKLARLAVATACRLFSTDNGENVVVRPEHVDFVYEFLCKSYDNPNMAYDKVSDRSRRGRIMTPEMKAKLREDMTKLEDADMLVASLSDLQMFSFTDMMYQMAYDPQDAKKVWRWLNANNLIEKAKARAGYVKTPAGIQFLRYMEANPIGIQEAEF